MNRSVPKGERDCLFCNIVKRKIPSKVVYEDQEAIAFEDVRPQAPVHLLIIPKKHITGLLDLRPEDEKEMGHLLSLVPSLAKEKGIAETGFRTVINTGERAGQSVFHLHLHLLGGRPFHWPPG